MDSKQVLQMLDQIMHSGKTVEAQLALMREVNRTYELSLSQVSDKVPQVVAPMTAARCYPMVRYADLRRGGNLTGWRETEIDPEAIGPTRNPVVRVVKFTETP